MTAARIVDVSALAAVAFGEPEADWVLARLEGYRWKAPVHLPFEMANVYLKKLRKNPQAWKELSLRFDSFLRLDVELFQVDHRSVVVLAQELRLTTYDASYLWLSRELGLELVTLDQELIAAAAH